MNRIIYAGLNFLFTKRLGKSLGLVALFGFLAPVALASPTLQWSTKQLVVEAPAGGATTAEVLLTSNETVGSVVLSVVPELAPYVELTPSALPMLEAGVQVSVSISVDLAAVAEPMELEGVLQVQRDDGVSRRRLAKPLPVQLVVTEDTEADTYTISGTVILGEEVTVKAFGPTEITTTTDVNGAFTLEDLRSGDYTIVPGKVNSTFTPKSIEVELIDRDVIGLVFEIQQAEEGLTPEQLKVIDALPTELTPADQIILPNGKTLEQYLEERGITPVEEPSAQPLEQSSSAQLLDGSTQLKQVDSVMVNASALPPAEGPQQRKNDVIAQMLAQARYYACGKEDINRCTTWDFPADVEDPDNKPAQQGLNYLWNSKDVTQRNKPDDICTELTYGFDCSGMILRVAEAAGITLPVNVAGQRKPDSWGIPPEWNLKMIEVTDGSTAVGDILVWDGHIGIGEGGGRFISSLGANNDCATNIGPKRGPRSITIGGFPGALQTRLRLVSTLSGTFDMPIRCSGNPQVVGTVHFDIDNDNGGPFQATGTGVDLDGSPLCFNLDGNYDISRNTLSGQLVLCNNSRVDSFSVELLTDATDWFALIKVVDNGGCPGEARFIRTQETSTAISTSSMMKLEGTESTGSLRYGGQ